MKFVHEKSNPKGPKIPNMVGAEQFSQSAGELTSFSVMELPTPGVQWSITAYFRPEKDVAQVGDIVPAISPNKTIRRIRTEFWLLKSPMGSTPQLGNVKTIKVY